MQYVERAPFIHDGVTYENHGAVIIDGFAMVYVKLTDRAKVIQVTDWHGNKLGAGVIVSEWDIYGSVFGTYRMRSVRFVIDGVCYSGRYNSDSGDLVRGRAVRSQDAKRP